jgi:hypothetical protein
VCTLFYLYSPPPPAVGLEKLGLFVTIGSLIWSVYIHAVLAPPPHHGVGGLLRNSPWTERVLIVPWTIYPELFSWMTATYIAFCDYSGQRTDLPYTQLNLHDNPYNFFLVSSLPGGRTRRKSYAGSASPPSIRAGWGWGCGWLGPPLFSVSANALAGAEAGDSPYIWQSTPILRPSLNVPRNFLP